MANLTLPASPLYSSITVMQVDSNGLNQSGWTGAQTALERGRYWFRGDVEYPPMRTSDGWAWEAVFDSLHGAVNTFDLKVTSADQYGGNNPLVRGANQTGFTFVTDGWQASKTVLKAGQFLTIGTQIVRLASDAVSGGTGIATLNLTSPVRTAPADNSTIEAKRPYVRARIPGGVPSLRHGLGGITDGFGFAWMEAF